MKAILSNASYIELSIDENKELKSSLILDRIELVVEFKEVPPCKVKISLLVFLLS